MLAYLRRNAIALLALFVALGGTGAYAAHLTVLSSDIVDGEVKSPDLAADAVTSSKIANLGVLNGDLNWNAVTSAKIANGNVQNGDLAANAVTTGKIADGSVQGADILNDGVTGADVNESTLGLVPNAAALDGYTSGAFYHLQRTARAYTSSCVTGPQTWVACAPYTVTVPSGHLYYVTVISSVTANPGNAFVEALFCPASTGPSCMGGSQPNRMTFEPNQFGNWTSSATSSYYAGSYTFNTAMKWPYTLPANSEAETTTTVLVYDYRQHHLTGP